MKDTRILSTDSIVSILKFPSMSVFFPVDVPRNKTLAKAIGSLVNGSYTRPVTFVTCPKESAGKESKNESENKSKSAFLYIDKITGRGIRITAGIKLYSIHPNTLRLCANAGSQLCRQQYSRQQILQRVLQWLRLRLCIYPNDT